MDTSEAWKYKRDWKEMRQKPLGEIVQMKFEEGGSPYRKALAEMELKRRTFVRDVLVDRLLAAAAIVISVIALVYSHSSKSADEESRKSVRSDSNMQTPASSSPSPSP